MNSVCLIGRLVRNAELETGRNGKGYAQFTIAVDRLFKNQGGERECDFIRCVAFDGTAEFISKYFHKGSRIGVNGSIRNKQREDKDGHKRDSVSVVVTHAYFCESAQRKVAGNGLNNMQEIPDEDVPF